jgi:hypothetical protein
VLNLAIAAVSTDKTLKELLIKCNMSAMKYLDSRSTSWSSVGAEIEFETENYEPFHDQTHASKVLEKRIDTTGEEYHVQTAVAAD